MQTACKQIPKLSFVHQAVVKLWDAHRMPDARLIRLPAHMHANSNDANYDAVVLPNANNDAVVLSMQQGFDTQKVHSNNKECGHSPDHC